MRTMASAASQTPPLMTAMATAATKTAAMTSQTSNAEKKLMRADDKEEPAGIKHSSASLRAGNVHG